MVGRLREYVVLFCDSRRDGVNAQMTARVEWASYAESERSNQSMRPTDGRSWRKQVFASPVVLGRVVVKA